MTERIWDRFLTPQDQAHVTAYPVPRVGFGQRPALLMVDLYRWVFGDAPQPLLEAVKTWPGSCGLAGWQALPHLQRLLAAARQAGIPIVHVTGLSEAASGVKEWYYPYSATAGPISRDPQAEDRRRRKYHIVDEVAPAPGEAVLTKTAPSAFFGTPLAAHLNYLGVDTLIVAGESTSGCVRATVVDACSYRFRVIVPEECTFDRHEATHAMNLFDMDQKYADVLPLAEVLDYLEGARAPQSAASRSTAPRA